VATIKQVEQRIFDVEGFEVLIRYGRDHRNIRSDKSHVRQYQYKRALKNSKNVKDWQEGRFADSFPGFIVDVLDAHGNKTHGRTLLGTVRDTYLSEA
jgi:hypothetical protein